MRVSVYTLKINNGINTGERGERRAARGGGIKSIGEEGGDITNSYARGTCWQADRGCLNRVGHHLCRTGYCIYRFTWKIAQAKLWLRKCQTIKLTYTCTRTTCPDFHNNIIDTEYASVNVRKMFPMVMMTHSCYPRLQLIRRRWMSKISFAGRQTDGGNVAPGPGGARREECVCVCQQSLLTSIYTQKDTLGHQQLHTHTAHNLSDSSVLFIPTVPVQNITTHTEGAIVLG